MRDLTDSELEGGKTIPHARRTDVRLKILQALRFKALAVSEIVAATGATQSNVSKHLSLMLFVEIKTGRNQVVCN
jgi:DNA-binding transcriptional ArsR family regulator